MAMKFLREASWEEVYQEWRKSETFQDFWKKEYQRRGFPSWEEFKAMQIELITRLNISRWQIFEVLVEEIPEFHVGAFQSWLKHAKRAGERRFFVLSKLPELQANTKVREIRKHFPEETQLIAFRKGNQIVLYEGHHRSTAIAQMLEEGKPVKSRITLALSELDPAKEYPFVDFRPTNRFHMWLWKRNRTAERAYRFFLNLRNHS